MPTCKCCTLDLPEDQFHPSNKSTCRSCRCARERARKAADPELAAQRKAYQDNYNKRYHAQHRTRLNVNSRQYRDEHLDEIRAYDRERSHPRLLREKFGLTPEEYASMLERQNERCPCGRTREENTAGRRLSVDHCHATGVNRGLLCDRCNRVVGLAGDSPDVLRALAAYLDAATLSATKGTTGN